VLTFPAHDEFKMISPSPVQDRIRFDDFEADLRTEELFRSGTKVRLPHQSFHVLAILLEKPGQLVTREELRARVWPAGTLVEYDQGLNAAIKRLREALRDSAETPRFIETLPKRGYRFIGAIQSGDSPARPAILLSVEPAVPETVATAPQPDVAAPHEYVGTEREPTGTADATSGSRRKILFGAAAALGLVLLASGAWWVVSHRSALQAQSGWEVVPFTSLPGQEIAPTFSPDGSQIAFAWNGGEGAGHQFDLYVKSLGSERLLQLTHQPSSRITPAWSPDGRVIAFIRQGDERSGIYVVPALGGTERRIVHGGIAVGAFRQISWSPDGKQLAFSRYGPKGLPQVELVTLESLTTQPLSPAPDCLDAAQPAFSPNGKQLALICFSSTAVYSIHTVELPHGPMKALTSIMGFPQGLAWSADGSRLIFSNDAGGGGKLWQLTLEGRLTKLPFGENSSEPAVARDGRVAYVRSRGTVNIWRANLTATQPEATAVRLIYSTLAQMVPRYSADGTRIAFQSNRSGSTEIWTTDAEGADPVRVTSFSGPLTSSPSWCSDGRRIAFDSRASGVSAIYVEDISERVPRKIVTSRPNLSSPVWSDDCRWLFAHDGNSALYRFPASGGRAERVIDHPSSYSVVVGDKLIFHVLKPDGVVLWSKPALGGPEERLEKIPKLRYGDSWVAIAAGIYYTDTSSKPVTVNFYEFANGVTRTVMTLKQVPVPSGPGIAVSPDGRWLLYTQVDDEQSEIMLADKEGQ
jgi:Tol biopolymer transport system component/DNA-binding winged helix-turn-helix (wHTH) protein